MRLLKLLTAIFFLLFGFNRISADVPRKLAKRIAKANRVGRNSQIEFERHFKYMGHRDTSAELCVSEYCANDSGLHTGWHRIYWQGSKQLRSMVVCTRNGISRLNESDLQLHVLQPASDRQLFEQYQNDLLYFPFTEISKHLQRYHIVSSKAGQMILEYRDSTAEKGGTFRYGYYKLFLDNQYRAVQMESRIISKGKTQYLHYKLLKIQDLPQEACPRISDLADSIQWELGARRNANMVKKQTDTAEHAINEHKSQNTVTGAMAPAFMIQLGESSTYHQFQITDSLLLLDFFYTTCAPCIKGQPMLNNLFAEFADSGLRVVGVNALRQDWGNIKNFAQTYGVKYPLLRALPQVLGQYHVSGYPRLVLIKNGIIAQVFYGYGESTETELRHAIQKALNIASPAKDDQ